MRRVLAAAASLLLLGAPLRADDDVAKKTVRSRGRDRVYYLYAPPGLSAEHPAPLVVTLHGSSRDGRTLVDRWKDLARQEGIVLAGPDSTDAVHWASPQDGPLLLRDVVDAVSAAQPIDSRRVYLFGHSAGAVFALQMACLESEYFAAAAVHAGAVDPRYFSIFDYAARKLPIAIWIGTKDPIFPPADVRATAAALKSRGFPVTLTEIPDHNHDYAAVAKDLNSAIWAFLAAQKLPAEPHYRVYADP
ncbi:MAG TPA: PHB depolymerase family esterase [Thermoanaerobaculia bacterium]|nr:PHB depolymerase family esterase [Thermoanaerobaculia bacterium]